MARHALTDEQWARIEPLLPRRPQGRKSSRGDRDFIDAVLFRAKTGIPWRDLPERFGPWKSIYNRFANWATKDHWATIFQELQLEEMDETGSIVDGSVVRAHQDAAGGKGGSNKMLWDALVEVFQRSSTRSSIRNLDRSTSHLPPDSGMRW
jgi:transposase